MTAADQGHLQNLFSASADLRNPAYHWAIAATEEPVDWAYEVWDRAVTGLTDKDNHVRAVSAQLLCNLAKSDPERRMLRDFESLLQVTRDPRFVTARHCLQNIWKVGLAGPDRLAILLAGLGTRFTESFSEKNGTLVRFDIIVDLANLHAALRDASLRESGLAWIDEEPDPRYRKKYLAVWK